jgi:hypothetical protein
VHPIYGCQIGSNYPIVHVKYDQVFPIHFSGDCTWPGTTDTRLSTNLELLKLESGFPSFIFSGKTWSCGSFMTCHDREWSDPRFTTK